MKVLLFLFVIVMLIWYCLNRFLFYPRPVSQQSQQSIGRSKVTAFDCIYSKKFADFGYIDDCLVPARLRNMDLTNPEVRGYNYDDLWLRDNAKEIGKDMHALAYLSHYGYIEDTFLSQYPDAETDISFQSRIMSVYKAGISTDGKELYRVNFSNLLCGYLKRWDFAPEIKEIIFNDERFRDVKRIYELFRDVETGKLKR